MFEQIKNNKKIIASLLAIIIVGVFLRTWHYSDIMRFGKDQARDAAIVKNIADGKEAIPLIGPRAYGTEFKMGPIFYYFQLASAKIFGVEPDKMAYPDLFLSIITIPIFYLYLRLYFERKISLALTALFSVSFFAVQNGRFAWNPNSLPLFTLLFFYAFHKISDPQTGKKILWSALAGLALGVGFQLHTLFILVIGAVFVLFGFYLLRKKLLNFKNIAIIIAVAVLLNVPQIFSEFKTDGQNTRAFFAGITQKSEKKNPFPLNLAMAAQWQAQANSMFILPLGDDSRPQFSEFIEKVGKNEKGIGNAILAKYPDVFARLLFGIIFSLAGYFFLWRCFQKETDTRKKIFLMPLILCALISFLVFIPLSHALMLRYFLILQFIPFLFLGLIANILKDKFGEKNYQVSLTIILLLALFNFYIVFKELRSFIIGKGDVQIAIWSEEKFAGEFILRHSQPGQTIYFAYEPQNANKFIRSLSYFNSTIDAPSIPNDGTLPDDRSAAIFSLILNTKKEISIWKRKIEKSNYEIVDSDNYGRLAIYRLKIKDSPAQ